MRVSRGLILALLVAGCAPHQTQTAEPAVAQPAIVATSLLEDVRILSADDMEGRLVGSAGGAKARAYLLGRLREIGVAPALGGGFEHPFETMRDGKPVPGVNLLGVVSGTSGSDRALVVMAHYDHVGVRNGQTYNGADDNASGVAAVLAIAESLKRQAPLHDVFLALVDGEEGGLSGARAMVADPMFRPVLDRTVLAMNFDMLSRSDKNELYASGAFHFPWLKPRLEAIAGSAPVSLKMGHDDPALGKDDWTGQSDHMAFHVAKKPWVYFGVEDHPDYHKPTDDFAAIPQDFFVRSAQTVEMAVRAFDRGLETIAGESANAAN